MARHHYFRFETKQQPLLSRSQFAWRLLANFGFATFVIGVSLAFGMVGYHVFEGMDWIDAYVNAAMILSGMGPLASPETWGGKFFAGSYALYSGLVVIVAASFIFAPIAHRILHRFHLEDQKD